MKKEFFLNVLFISTSVQAKDSQSQSVSSEKAKDNTVLSVPQAATLGALGLVGIGGIQNLRHALEQRSLQKDIVDLDSQIDPLGILSKLGPDEYRKEPARLRGLPGSLKREIELFDAAQKGQQLVKRMKRYEKAYPEIKDGSVFQSLKNFFTGNTIKPSQKLLEDYKKLMEKEIRRAL